MTEEGKYIYCIIDENKEKRFGSIGINNREVGLIHHKDISAVVSSAPIINFDRLDKKELTRYVAVHQKVNEEVMKDYDVCPMAFGIIAPSIAETLRLLEGTYLQLKTALKKVAGKTEFVVQVRQNQKKLLEELVHTVPEIQELKQELSKKKGISKIPTKLKLGKLIHQAMEARRQADIQDIRDIQNSLIGLACDCASNRLNVPVKNNTFNMACPVDSAAVSWPFRDMLANFSFLLEKAREPELDKKMQELGKKYEGKLRFKYIGPMPPYSFVNINLSLGNFEVVDEARKLLGLREEAAFDEIKKAYYALSHKYHPDKYGGESGTGEKMKKIAQAYSLLENYCQGCNGFIRKVEGQRYSFKKEDVRNSIIMKRL